MKTNLTHDHVKFALAGITLGGILLLTGTILTDPHGFSCPLVHLLQYATAVLMAMFLPLLKPMTYLKR